MSLRSDRIDVRSHNPVDQPSRTQPVEARDDVVHRDPHRAREGLCRLHAGEHLEDVGEASNHHGDQPRPPGESDGGNQRAGNLVDDDPARISVVSCKRCRRPERENKCNGERDRADPPGIPPQEQRDRNGERGPERASSIVRSPQTARDQPEIEPRCDEAMHDRQPRWVRQRS